MNTYFSEAANRGSRIDSTRPSLISATSALRQACTRGTFSIDTMRMRNSNDFTKNVDDNICLSLLVIEF